MTKNKIEFERKSLRKWIELEEARSKIKDVLKTKNATRAAVSIFAYIQLAQTGQEDYELDKLYAPNVFTLFLEAFTINSPRMNFPILKSAADKNEKLPWEYEGRSWYFWLNLLSEKYGWNMDYISLLDIDDAIGLYQEIEIDRQLQKEWEWGLSEIAYQYDKASKSSKFHPLSRPSWMRPIAPKPKIIKIKRDFLPVGNVIGTNELDKAVGLGTNP